MTDNGPDRDIVEPGYAMRVIRARCSDVLSEADLAELEAGAPKDIFDKLLAALEAIDIRHDRLERRLADSGFMTDAEAAFIDGEGEARH
jgi:hypothetical protein